MLGSLQNAKMSNGLSKGILKPNHRSQMGKYKLTLILLHFDLLCFTDISFFTKWRQNLPPAKGRQLVLLRSSLSCSGLEANPQYLACKQPRNRAVSRGIRQRRGWKRLRPLSNYHLFFWASSRNTKPKPQQKNTKLSHFSSVKPLGESTASSDSKILKVRKVLLTANLAISVTGCTHQ